jgi:hypothetical protein
MLYLYFIYLFDIKFRYLYFIFRVWNIFSSIHCLSIIIQYKIKDNIYVCVCVCVCKIFFLIQYNIYITQYRYNTNMYK